MQSLVQSMDASHAGVPALVLSNEANAGGLAKAEALGIPTTVVSHRDFESRVDFDNAIHAELVAADIDLVCFAGFMRIVGPEFSAVWDGRALNIHPALLPKFKGLNTHARALEAGEAEHGCTVHEVTSELDAGPIRGQARLDVLDTDTPETLAARVLELEHRLYPLVLRRFAAGEGGIVSI